MANKRIYELGTTADNSGRFFALDENGLPSALKIAADAYYLKTETDSLLTGYYTRGEVDTLLTGYVTDAELSTALSSYYTKTEVDTKFTGYYTMLQIDNAFTLYYTKTEIDSMLTNYYLSSEVDALVEARMNWMNVWEPLEYVINDVVRDGEWTMIANKTTTERAGPQPAGDPFFIYDGTLTDQSISAKRVIFGTRYTWGQSGYLQSIRVYVTAGFHYDIYTVNDPLGTPIVNYVLSFDASETGWQSIAVDRQIVLAGALFDLVANVNEPDPTPTTWTGDWNYTTPNNENTPGVGVASQANKASDLLKINKTDQASADRGAELLAMTPGDQIEFGGTTWTIQSVTDSGNVVVFGVTPATQSTDGVGTFTFYTVTATPIPYGEEVGAWTGIAYAKGLYGADVNYADIVPNDNAYGMDIEIQAATVSEDWDAVAFSAGGAVIGGGGGGGTYVFGDGLTETAGVVKLGGEYVATVSIKSNNSNLYSVESYDSPGDVGSGFYLSGPNIEFYVEDYNTNDFAYISISKQNIYLIVTPPGGTMQLGVSATTGFSISDLNLNAGLSYSGDYQTQGVALFGDRWVPDKGYVDSVAGQGGTTQLYGTMTAHNPPVGTRYVEFLWNAGSIGDAFIDLDDLELNGSGYTVYVSYYISSPPGSTITVRDSVNRVLATANPPSGLGFGAWLFIWMDSTNYWSVVPLTMINA